MNIKKLIKDLQEYVELGYDNIYVHGEDDIGEFRFEEIQPIFCSKTKKVKYLVLTPKDFEL